jgi:hypothetical protein
VLREFICEPVAAVNVTDDAQLVSIQKTNGAANDPTGRGKVFITAPFRVFCNNVFSSVARSVYVANGCELRRKSAHVGIAVGMFQPDVLQLVKSVRNTTVLPKPPVFFDISIFKPESRPFEV